MRHRRPAQLSCSSGRSRRSDLFTAKQAGLAGEAGVQRATARSDYAITFPLSLQPDGKNPISSRYGRWKADSAERPSVFRTDRSRSDQGEYQTRCEREAFAIYSQSVYTFNEHFAFTLGARWARDQLNGEEQIFSYNEDNRSHSLRRRRRQRTAMNVLIGAMDRAARCRLQPVAHRGVPVEPNRCGGNCIGRMTPSRGRVTWTGRRTTRTCSIFRSPPAIGPVASTWCSSVRTPSTSRRSLIAYELGYKGELFDGTMQVNSALYFYDYKNVHTFARGSDRLWRIFDLGIRGTHGRDDRFRYRRAVAAHATDYVGRDVSYTHSEYTDDFFLIDVTNPRASESRCSTVFAHAQHQRQLRCCVYRSEGRRYAQYAWQLRRSRFADVPGRLRMDRQGVLFAFAGGRRQGAGV